MRPRFDAELAVALSGLANALPPSLTPELIAPMRTGSSGLGMSDSDLACAGRVEVAEREIPGAPGSPAISLLVLRPRGVPGSLPCLLHLHGGGMVAGDNRTGIADVLDAVLELGVVVVSVEYRLAPEHPHPAPAEDCYSALTWVVEQAAELGVDPDRVVLAGRSAGGGLAAGVALMARDRGGPAVLAQLLLCPMLDDREVTPSSTMLEGEGLWDRISNRTGWDALLGSARGGPGVSPYAAPARAQDLGGLPPAFLDVGSAELFRDECVDYAQRIWQAGGDAELHVWPGGFHGFDLLAPAALLSRSAHAAQAAWLRRILTPRVPGPAH